MCKVTNNSLSPSLESLVEAANGNDLKFVFCGGKGGVGKTTSSSAIATLLTNVSKKRVLLISTDPAHSLGDAWRTKFSNVPTSPMKNLDVMEVDPKETLRKELESWSSHIKKLSSATAEEDEDSDNPLASIDKFQEWLTGIPGIDEATALSSAMSYIESGDYDIIVFDTAPTGHTLKLLALPAILEKGISQLQSWSSKLWGYWETFKAVTKSGSTSGSVNAVKAEVAKKLVDYKENIQKVTAMLQDQTRTRFVVICIAEFLSISETKRLLQELKKNQIRASHVIVNQLVVENALSKEELSRLEALAEVGDLKIDPTLLEKTIHACRLTTARKEIQQKYLNELIAFESSNDILEGLCQVPLLSMEPTGNDAILYFSKLLMKDVNTKIASSTEPIVPSIGETVRVMQLEKSPQFNGSEGKVITKIDEVTGRVGVSILTENNKKKKLSLLPKNLSIVRTLPSPKKSIESDSATKESKVETESDIRKDHVDPGSDNSIMTKKVMKVIEEDPEIRDLVQTNPRLKDAIDDCASNPSNAMKYISDPEMSPYIFKILGKIKF